MNRSRSTAVLAVTILLGSGCAKEDQTALAARSAPKPAVIATARITPAISPAIALRAERAPAGHSSSRSYANDYDADGIADYRVTVTRTYDDAGNLISRTREEDFEADGVIDARVVTTFDERP
jgi:hypothetical protein